MGSTDLTKCSDEMDNGVAVEVSAPGEDSVDGDEDALAGRLGHRLPEVPLADLTAAAGQRVETDAAQCRHLSAKDQVKSTQDN